MNYDFKQAWGTLCFKIIATCKPYIIEETLFYTKLPRKVGKYVIIIKYIFIIVYWFSRSILNAISSEFILSIKITSQDIIGIYSHLSWLKNSVGGRVLVVQIALFGLGYKWGNPEYKLIWFSNRSLLKRQMCSLTSLINFE